MVNDNQIYKRFIAARQMGVSTKEATAYANMVEIVEVPKELTERAKTAFPTKTPEPAPETEEKADAVPLQAQEEKEEVQGPQLTTEQLLFLRKLEGMTPTRLNMAYKQIMGEDAHHRLATKTKISRIMDKKFSVSAYGD